jgi:hypothetical protein
MPQAAWRWILLPLAWGLCCAFSEATTSTHIESVHESPSIILFNDVPFHLEVVAGFLYVLKSRYVNFKAYLRQTKDNLQHAGFLEFIGTELSSAIRSSQDDHVDKADLLIMISPEYNIISTKAFHTASQPNATIVLLHEINDQRVADLVALQLPRTKYITLSPHTAAAARELLNISVEWMLPVMPFTPSVPSCSVQACQSLQGFVTQGVVDTARRNFSRIWDDLAYLRAHYNIHEPVQVLGWGDYNHSSILVPVELVDQVNVLGGMPFPKFYSTVYHSRAILLYFMGGSTYVRWRFTSSVLTSLATGTPVITPRATLRAYKMLPRACVHVQQVGICCQISGRQPSHCH